MTRVGPDGEVADDGAPVDRRIAIGPPSVRLVFPAPAGRDISWEVAFAKAGRR